MPAGEIRINDFGWIARATIKDEEGDVVNVSGYTTKQLIFTKPNNSQIVKNASFYTDGTDGIIQYVVTSGDITVKGTWQLQGYVYDGTRSLHSDIVMFQVLGNL